MLPTDPAITHLTRAQLLDCSSDDQLKEYLQANKDKLSDISTDLDGVYGSQAQMLGGFHDAKAFDHYQDSQYRSSGSWVYLSLTTAHSRSSLGRLCPCARKCCRQPVLVQDVDVGETLGVTKSD